jgi:hypothetical protein
MSQSQPPSSRTGPLLDEDFAARVLKRVDAHMTLRRRMRVGVAGLAAGCVVAAAVVMNIRAVSPTAPASPPATAAAFVPSDDQAADEQADALGYLFPDAAPLAEFDNTYFVTDSAGEDILPPYGTDDDGSP